MSEATPVDPGDRIEAIRARFMSFVQVDPVTGCWIWQGHCDDRGYGKFSDGGTKRAIRVAFRLFKGRRIRRDHNGLHSCDRPPCVNPDHLTAGTQRTNVLDMIRKGRHGAQRHPEIYQALILKVNGSKLKPDQVREIRRSTESTRALAARFQVNRLTIQRVRSREFWGSVHDDILS